MVLNGQLASGTSAAEAARGKRQELTLKAVAGLYLDGLKLRGAKSGSPDGLWTKYIGPAFGTRRMSEITWQDLERWHRGLPEQIRERRAAERAERERTREERRARIVQAQAGRKRGPDPKPKAPSLSTMVIKGESTANQALELVRTIYRWAAMPERKLFVGINPATGHKLFATDERERFLLADELRPFFLALAELSNDTMRDFILLALLTGARRSNVASMAWANVSLDRAEWRVPGALMKNGQQQTITLVPEAVEILRGRKEIAGDMARFVFPSAKSKSGHIEDPRKAWQSVMRAAKLADLRLHDLRRTLGSWQTRTGASLVMVGKALNHKDPASSAIYARLDLDPVRESVDRATSAMFDAAGLKSPA
jgi:integrase